MRGDNMDFCSNYSNYAYAKKKPRRRLFIVLIVIFTCFFAACSKTSTAWQEFVPAEGTFKVLFPGQPMVSDKVPASSDGRGLATVYGVNNENQGSFMVTRIEIDDYIQADEFDERLDFVLQGMKEKYSEKLLGDQVVWCGKHQGLVVAVGPRCILICCVAHVPNMTRYSASSLLAYQAHQGPF